VLDYFCCVQNIHNTSGDIGDSEHEEDDLDSSGLVVQLLLKVHVHVDEEVDGGDHEADRDREVVGWKDSIYHNQSPITDFFVCKKVIQIECLKKIDSEVEGHGSSETDSDPPYPSLRFFRGHFEGGNLDPDRELHHLRNLEELDDHFALKGDLVCNHNNPDIFSIFKFYHIRANLGDLGHCGDTGECIESGDIEVSPPALEDEEPHRDMYRH